MQNMEPNEGLKEKQEDTQQGRYLTFSLGKRSLGWRSGT